MDAVGGAIFALLRLVFVIGDAELGRGEFFLHWSLEADTVTRDYFYIGPCMLKNLRVIPI